jgi:glutamate N-acetyltransferase / amino-acid N-acetyltransferase
MATMLCYILTDIDISRDKLQSCLSAAVETSFNAITVDGDQSTSDTVLLMSSKKVAATGDELKEFEVALKGICSELAEDIVRNGKSR